MDLRFAVGRVARTTHGRPRLIGPISLALSAALVAALGVVGSAAAATPYSERFVDGPHVDVIDCGTFSATLVRNLTGTDTFFVDQQDNLIREQVNAHMVGTLTSDTGAVVNLRGNLLFVFDPVKGTFTFDGQVFMANRPGLGVVIHDTGTYVTDWDNNVLHDAGPHDVVDGDGSIFCAALL